MYENLYTFAPLPVTNRPLIHNSVRSNSNVHFTDTTSDIVSNEAIGGNLHLGISDYAKGNTTDSLRQALSNKDLYRKMKNKALFQNTQSVISSSMVNQF